MGSSSDKYSPNEPFHENVDMPVPDAYVPSLAQPVVELVTTPSKAVYSGYDPDPFEEPIATYPLSEFAVIATSGYFRRGLSWGPVYSATTLESTEIDMGLV